MFSTDLYRVVNVTGSGSVPLCLQPTAKYYVPPAVTLKSMHSARGVCVTYGSQQILITSLDNINRLVNGEGILFPLRYELNLCTTDINFSLDGVKGKITS